MKYLEALISTPEEVVIDFCEFLSVGFMFGLIVIALIMLLQENVFPKLLLSRKKSDDELIADLNRYREKNKRRYAKMCNYIKQKFKLYGEVTATSIGDLQYIIYLDGEYLGVYDLNTHTFN